MTFAQRSARPRDRVSRQRLRSRRPALARSSPASNGTITIDVPLSQVGLDPGVASFSTKLYSVTASTMTLPKPANTICRRAGLFGVPFNLIDVVRGYDAKR